jgi:hypothetical protein
MPESEVRLATRLYDCRRMAKHMLGKEFPEFMAVYQGGIRAVMERDACEEIPAALTLIKSADDEFEGICILAAAVEMIEPEGKPNAD